MNSVRGVRGAVHTNKSFYPPLTKTYIFLADKSSPPPSSTDLSANNVSFFPLKMQTKYIYSFGPLKRGE